MSELDELLQSSNAGRLIELFELDMTAIGGPVVHFTCAPTSGQPVLFGGVEYSPIPVEASGFEWSGRGALPTPTIKVQNVSNVFSAAVISYDDLLGATLTRKRTFEVFLDTGASPDSTMYLPVDIYRIERKITQNKVYIEFELAAAMDHAGKMLPARQVLRDICTHRYRRWDRDLNDFDYTKATCPYTGLGFFKTDGTPCTSAEDKCGKRLSSCALRFGEDPLPTRAFPGVARVRV